MVKYVPYMRLDNFWENKTMVDFGEKSVIIKQSLCDVFNGQKGR